MIGIIPHKERIRRSEFQWSQYERNEERVMRHHAKILQKLKEDEVYEVQALGSE